MRNLIPHLTLAATLCTCLTAQHARSENALPGRIAGTEQWIVHFARRSFDLREFRTAIHANRPWSEIAPILAKYRTLTQTDQAGFRESVTQLGGRVFLQYWIVNAAAIEIPPEQLAAIRKLPNVLRLEPNQTARPVLLEATNGANHNSDAVNRLGYRGKGIATAIVDSGIDSNCGNKNRPHQTFYEDGDLTKRNRLLDNVAVGSFPADNNTSHGTGVAGVAAGGRWAGPLADHGHAPHADVVGYSITDAPGGNTTAAVMALSWQYVARDAARYRIKTANNSYYGWPDPLHVTSQAMDAAARNADVLIVVACGNSMESTALSQSCANGIAVGAVHPRSHVMAFFSSRGPLALDPQRTYPDIVACGVSTNMPLVDAETRTYTASGTSMAAPQVCGAATLLRSAVSNLRADQTKAILLATAEDIRTQNPNPPYNTRNAYGLGLLRDDAAIQVALDATAHGRATITSSNPTWQTTVSVKRGRHYRAVATWMRQVMTSKSWSNFSIEILDGNQQVAIANSPRNLYEVVNFRATADGQRTLRVRGLTIETGAQEFAWAFAERPIATDKAEFETFGLGCPGLPLGIRSCVTHNWSQTLSNTTTNAKRICLLTLSDPLRNLTGIRLYTMARNAPTRVQVSIVEFDVRTAKPGTRVLASGSMTVGTSAGVYRAVMQSQLNFPYNRPLCIVFDQADQLILPIAPRGIPHRHFEDRSGWGRVQFANWQYQIECNQGPVRPVMTAQGFPAIGQTFRLDLTDVPPSRPVVFGFGWSDTAWGSTPLPFTFAPSCQLRISLDSLTFHIANAGGQSSLQVPVPNRKDILGLRFYSQGFAASAVNAFGVISSNAARARIGEH